MLGGGGDGEDFEIKERWSCELLDSAYRDSIDNWSIENDEVVGGVLGEGSEGV